MSDFMKELNYISDAVQRDWSTGLVTLSHPRIKRHITFLMHVGFIRKMHLYLPLFALIIFSTSPKKWWDKIFFFCLNLAFISLVSDGIPPNAH